MNSYYVFKRPPELHEPYKELKHFYDIVHVFFNTRTVLHEPYKELKQIIRFVRNTRVELHEPYKELKQSKSAR